MVVFEAFADASGTSRPCRIMSVASFLFDKSKSAELDSEWGRILDPFLSHLPSRKRYFHMTNFMAHREPYDKLNEGEWLSLRHDLIESATKRLEFAVVCSVDVDEYERELSLGDKDPVVEQRIDRRMVLGGPFTMCSIWTMRALSDYIDGNNKPGNIAYFFEAGDPGQRELCARINEISKSTYLSERYRYSGHSFVPKQFHHALGAADMLAWEYRKGAQESLCTPSTFRRSPFFKQMFNAPIGALHFSLPHLQIQTMAMVIEEANRWAEEQTSAADKPE